MLLRVQSIISFFGQCRENAETAGRMVMNWGLSLKLGDGFESIQSQNVKLHALIVIRPMLSIHTSL